ncbi:MAG: hypothetical protein QOD31_2786, partial [Pseudonocardiales bacterium]|nr:hypothetical protein [Pseudonocardiales bacterium]
HHIGNPNSVLTIYGKPFIDASQ